MKKHTPFRFKEFSIYQDNSAMKVGTDGVLLGSWVMAQNPKNILDIGAGTGLLCLMMAQRFKAAKIVGVESNSNAIIDAVRNATLSVFADRIKIIQTKIQDFKTDERFDIILSNPPFFQDALNGPNADRNQARHAVELTPNELLSISESLLTQKGKLSVIIPYEQTLRYEEMANQVGLFLTTKTSVRGAENKPFKRSLLIFQKQQLACEKNELTIEHSRHVYTDEYIALTKDFYLAM